ncbi:MAG: AraC family transcriptional regulator [Moraxellaceae bacterium]|jgi:AraC-like DNA-binding protein|nr:AraC family transcriptional regulator [Moraxellaceae bacterium]
MDTLSQILDDIHLSGGEFRYIQAGAPWAFAFRTEGRAGFHLVLSGEAWLYPSNEPPIRLEPGDMAVVMNGRDHALVHEKMAVVPDTLPDLVPGIQGHNHDLLKVGGTGYLTNTLSARFRFDADLGRPLLAALPAVLVMRGISDSPPEWLRIGLDFLAQEGLGRPGHQAIINRLVGILFIECVRDYVESLPEGANNWLRALRDPALSPVLAAIHQRPAHPWTVNDLAGIACLSRSAFAERFGTVMGQPPLSYLAEHRMRLALWQLCHTQQPVCRIAEMVGYGSETAFSQAFKRMYGSSPSRYRQQRVEAPDTSDFSPPAAPARIPGQAG